MARQKPEEYTKTYDSAFRVIVPDEVNAAQINAAVEDLIRKRGWVAVAQRTGQVVAPPKEDGNQQ